MLGVLPPTDPDAFWTLDSRYLLSFFEGLIRERGEEAETALNDLYEEALPKPKPQAEDRRAQIERVMTAFA